MLTKLTICQSSLLRTLFSSSGVHVAANSSEDTFSCLSSSRDFSVWTSILLWSSLEFVQRRIVVRTAPHPQSMSQWGVTSNKCRAGAAPMLEQMCQAMKCIPCNSTKLRQLLLQTWPAWQSRAFLVYISGRWTLSNEEEVPM